MNFFWFNQYFPKFHCDQKQYSIKRNSVYILPDPGMDCGEANWLYAHFSINQSNIPTIDIPSPQESYEILDKWFIQNQDYACGEQRSYFPDMDKVMENISQSHNNLDKIAG